MAFLVGAGRRVLGGRERWETNRINVDGVVPISSWMWLLSLLFCIALSVLRTTCTVCTIGKSGDECW